MEYELIGDGRILVKYDISYINATYEEDREDMLGVCRMTDVEIECDGKLPNEIMHEIKRDILNHFADKEYFTANFDWRIDAENAISEYTGASNINVDLE